MSPCRWRQPWEEWKYTSWSPLIRSGEQGVECFGHVGVGGVLVVQHGDVSCRESVAARQHRLERRGVVDAGVQVVRRVGIDVYPNKQSAFTHIVVPFQFSAEPVRAGPSGVSELKFPAHLFRHHRRNRHHLSPVRLRNVSPSPGRRAATTASTPHRRRTAHHRPDPGVA